MLSFCKVKPQLLVPQAFIQHLLRNAEFHEWKRNEISLCSSAIGIYLQG